MIPATSGAARTRTQVAGGPARPRLRAWYASAARIPLTLSCVAVLWLLGLGTASVIGGPPPPLDAQVGVGVAALAAGRWWTPLTAAGFAPNLISYLATTALLLGLVAPAERRVGSARTALLLVVTQVAGTLAAVGAVGLGVWAGDEWSRQLTVGTAVGPSTAAVGVALGLSARLSALWRRRVRLLLLIGLVMLALYSGLLQDVLRLGCGLVGLLAGPWLLGRRPRRHPLTASRPEQRVLIALFVAASAAGPLIAAVSDTAIGPLSVLRYLMLTPPPDAATVAQVCLDQAAANDCRSLQAQLRLFGIGPAVMSILPVVVLLVLAEGLRRGRRFAWYGALVGNLALAALGVLLAIEVATTPADRLVVFAELGRPQGLLAVVVPLVQPLLVAALLLATRNRFPVTAPAGTYTRLAILAAATLGIASVVYVGGGYLLREQFDRPPTLLDLLADLPTRFLPPGYLGEIEPTFLPAGWAATVLYEWTGVVVLTVAAVGLTATFGRHRIPGADDDLARVRVLARQGGTALSHLSTWAGHSYWFTPAGDAAIAYRVIGGVAITTADPLGPCENQQLAVDGFAAFCAQRGWTPCLYSITEPVRTIADERGWSSVQVAEDTRIPLGELAFTGKRWQDVRTALNRATKAGISAEWIRYRHAPLVITDQIRAISEEWVADKGLPEMGFTLGGLDELADDDVRCLIAVDADRTVHAVTSWLPVHHDGRVIGWTLDFMRRRRSGFRPAMEFLIAAAALACQADGAQFMSLSGAPLARLDRSDRTDRLQRLVDRLGVALEPVYGFGSLLAFKAKFQPDYQPLFMAYLDPAALPAIAAALTRAYLPRLDTRDAARLAHRLLRPTPSGTAQ